MIEELDVVEFLRPGGEWPAGTRGAVILASKGEMLVELKDDEDFVTGHVWMPTDQLRRIGKWGFL
jgi:hypothetical protein